MKGYRRKDEASTNGSSNGARDSGIFTGINGDANSLVDETFDYKKHTVKDLAAHFALVKPKQNIPSNILPEQRIFNGGQAPQLNYLGANEAGATVTSQHTSRRELSQQDIEASKQAYEMKKKQQMEAQQSQQVTSTTTTDSSSVVRRTTETSSSSEQKSERRMSLRDSLMLDPAQAHAAAGLIDPSAILRGEAVTHWKSSDPSHTQLSVGAVSSSPSTQMYISRKDPNKTFAPVKFSTLPRRSSSNSSSSSSLGQLSKSHLPPLPPANSSSKPPVSAHANTRTLAQQQVSPSPKILISNTNAASSFTAFESKSSSNPLIVLDSPSPVPQSQSDSLHKSTLPPSPSITQQIVSEKQSVIHSMLKSSGSGHGDTGQDELAVSVSRSSAPTPCPTSPFPGLDSATPGLTIPSSPSLRPRTPILVTTRPSSVSLDRTRHVSKEDIAKMMAELNEPLPPMLDIPTEIRASPLIFSGGLAAVPSHPNPQSSPYPHSALSSSTIMSPSSTVRNQ